MPVPANRILDLAQGIGQVQSTVIYQILDRDLNVVGEVNSLTDCTVAASTSAAVKRQLSGFKLSERDLRKVDLFQHRIRVLMLLEDGTSWPLGVYVFTDSAKNVGSYISTLDTVLMDQDYILTQGIRNPYGVNPGGSITDAINAILDEAGIFQRDVPGDATVRVGDPVSWPPGTSRSEMLKVLCNLAGWLPPYFNNGGVCVVRPPTTVINVEPDHYYDLHRVAYNTLIENDNLLQAPNVYVVISTGPSKGDISATAEVDANLPFSVPNRGFVVTSVHRTQGLTSTRQAQDMADALAAQGSMGFKTVYFTGPPDPRHDLYETIEYDGTIYNEVEWSLPLKGASMSHSLTLGGFLQKDSS